MYLLFFSIWVILNGRITLEVVLFGIAVATLMFAFICKFMGYSIKKEIWLFKNFFLLLFRQLFDYFICDVLRYFVIV